MDMRERVAVVINNRYYVPPGVMAEMADAILALFAEAREAKLVEAVVKCPRCDLCQHHFEILRDAVKEAARGDA